MPAKFGYISGGHSVNEYPVAASAVFKHSGGAWVQKDSAGRVALATDAVTDLFGWAETGDFTASSTAGQTKVAVNVAWDAQYEMPIAAATTEATLQGYIGKFCDLAVVSNVQYVAPATTTTNVLEVMGYRYYGAAAGQQSLIVRRVPKNMTTQT